MKRLFISILVLLLAIPNIVVADTRGFSDLPEGHWAYEAVNEMASRGIISGYDDGTFRPNEAISRAEFATVMVLALGLEPNLDAKSTYTDLSDSHWVLPYVDVAKQYLTGYQSSSGVKFKPDDAAVREDMAVAIVRAKGYQVASSDVNYLNTYTDEESVSGDLKKFVGAAIKNGVMIGTTSNGSKSFNPVGELTRAEACALLLNIVDKEEKIVLDDQSLLLEAGIVDHQVKLAWHIGDENELQGFKVVASKSNDSPSYPEDGYVKYLSANSRSIALSGPMSVHGGDVGFLAAGEAYYFTITALYKDSRVTSNSVHLTYPGTETSDIILQGSIENNTIVLEWSGSGYSGYKVVASKSDTRPIYPENGYYTYTNDQRITIPIGSYYNNGDFEQFISGIYNFSITGLMGDEKIPSNTIQLVVDSEVSDINLQGELTDNGLVLEWDDQNDYDGYKVVASKSDGSPIYPEDGYFKYISKGQDKRVFIEANSWYNKGDIERFKAGESYYFAITGLYGDQKISSNVVQFTFKDVEEPVVKLFGSSGENIVLEWTDENDSMITGFKVVASKSDGSPIYPEDGYYKYIEKGQDQRVVIEADTWYNNGDIDSFKSGETYYFAITALAGDLKVSSNVLALTFNEVPKPIVTLEGAANGNEILLEWVSYNDHNVDGYKVVASKVNEFPVYPNDGYFQYIRNGESERSIINLKDTYHNGSFDKFEAGGYYFSITTLYDGKKVTSNTIYLELSE